MGLPDYTEYLNLKEWDIKTAVTLALGLNPNRQKAFTYDQKLHIKNALKRANYAIHEKKILPGRMANGRCFVKPEDFLPWAVTKWPELRNKLPASAVIQLQAEGHAITKTEISITNATVLHGSVKELKESVLESEKRNIQKDKEIKTLKSKIKILEPDAISHRRKKEGGKKGGVNSGKARRGEQY